MDIKLDTDVAETQSEYVVIDLSPEVARAIGPAARPGLAKAFGANVPSNSAPTVGVGDAISVRIWESSSDGLFASPAGKSTSIPAVVGPDGNVFLPYAGKVPIAGLTLESARERIQNQLVGKAVDPQVSVSLGENGTRTVSVVGDVAKSGRIPVPDSGLRLLDAVAIAGGPREASFDTEIRIVRERLVGSVRFDDLLRYPENNIWLRPRDTVQLRYEPRSFTSFGAVRSSKQQKFTTEGMNLAEAVAQSGGLNASTADKGGVFLFRFEPPSRIARVGAALPERKYPNGVPTIYRLDLSNPAALFVAQSIEIKDKDMIYVAVAPAVEFKSFLDAIVSPFLITGERIQDLQN